MKNIFEDETLPSVNEKPPIIKNDGKAAVPSRPKRQVTPPPMKQAWNFSFRSPSTPLK